MHLKLSGDFATVIIYLSLLSCRENLYLYLVSTHTFDDLSERTSGRVLDGDDDDYLIISSEAGEYFAKLFS